MGRQVWWSALLGIGFAMVGCSPAPVLRSDADRAESTHYLTGVDSPWSARLDRLGDAEFLDAESSMRHALVGGDETFYVATSGFRVGDTLALDMIVINHRQEEVTLRRADVHLVDAAGRWLTPMPSSESAAARGLQGRSFVSTTPSTLFQDFGGDFLDQDFSLGTTEGGLSGLATKGTSATSRRHNRAYASEANSRIETSSAQLRRPVTAVRVGPDQGRAFWAYFEGADPEYPLTAVIMLEGGEELRFRFDR